MSFAVAPGSKMRLTAPMRLLPWVTLVLVVGCASSPKLPTPDVVPDAGPTVEAETDEARKARLTALFEREAEGLPRQAFSAAGAALTVESSQPVTVARDEQAHLVTFTLGLGGTQPLTCTLFEDGVDVGGRIFRVLSAIKSRGQLVPLRPASVEVIERFPAVFLDLGYLMDQQGTLGRGQVKVLAYSSDDASLVCLHDEPGYARTFKRVASALAAELARALAKVREVPVFRSVDLLSTQGLTLGFARTSWFRNPDGTLRLVSVGSMVVPRSQSDWLTTDQLSVTLAAKDGTVTRKRGLLWSNGEVEKDVTLERKKAGTYAYQGTVQGKALQGELKTRDGKDLASDLLQARRIKQVLLSGKKAELRLEDYLPEANPVALTPVTMQKLPGPGRVSAWVGTLQLEGTFDADGVSQKSSMQAGPATIVQERLFSEGSAK